MSEFDWELIKEKLKNVQWALTTIEERFRQVPNVKFFQAKAGWERRDGICMLFIAIGESFKQIDELANKTFLLRYPEIEWRKVIGFRNIIAHNYFDINEVLLFDICATRLSPLLETVNRMIADLQSAAAQE